MIVGQIAKIYEETKMICNNCNIDTFSILCEMCQLEADAENEQEIICIRKTQDHYCKDCFYKIRKLGEAKLIKVK